MHIKFIAIADIRLTGQLLLARNARGNLVPLHGLMQLSERGWGNLREYARIELPNMAIDFIANDSDAALQVLQEAANLERNPLRRILDSMVDHVGKRLLIPPTLAAGIGFGGHREVMRASTNRSSLTVYKIYDTTLTRDASYRLFAQANDPSRHALELVTPGQISDGLSQQGTQIDIGLCKLFIG